jgi:gas vesicle protein
MSDNMKQLLKLLLGAGLLFAEPNRRERAAEKIKDRIDDWSETAKDRYDDAVECMERIARAARGRELWAPKVGSFLLGIGVGVGMGMLFAPAPGNQTRSSIAEQATNLKEKVRQTVRRESASADLVPQR